MTDTEIRDLSMAISEFAPGATLRANKLESQSGGIKLVPEKALETKSYKRCQNHNALVSWADGEEERPLPCGDEAAARGGYLVPIFGFVASHDSPRPERPAAARLHEPSVLPGTPA